MNKLEQLQAEINRIPDELHVPRSVLGNLLGAMALGEMRTYSLGLYDMAARLTTDEALLGPIRNIQELLK